MERTHDEDSPQKNQSRFLYEDLCADGTLRRCNQNQVKHMRKTTGCFTNFWRTKKALESYFEEHAREVLGEKLDES